MAYFVLPVGSSGPPARGLWLVALLTLFAFPREARAQPLESGTPTPVMEEVGRRPQQPEIEQIDARLAEIRRQRPSIVGPIVLLALGGGLCGGALFLMPFAYDSPDGTGAGPLLGIGVVGALVSVGSAIWLVKRRRARRAFAPEIQRLRLRRRDLREMYGFDYGVDPAVNGLRFTVSGRF
ncbi:MAG: hypothetical protein QM778_07310 [Myxococcales bacterium]